MSTLKHDSRMDCYRWPQGAQVTGASVRLRLSAPEGAVCTLRLWSEKGEQKHPMRLRGYMNGSALYEYTLTLPDEPVILWYSFIVQTGADVYWYGNNKEQLGGEGAQYPYQPPSFQITVYDKDFKTPAWMHDGIMYQIFVDRFSHGGQPLTYKKPHLNVHKNWYEKPEPYRDEPVGWDWQHDFFGGNLRGIIEKMPYLKKLGVTALYLNPIFEAQSNHKYDTADYEKVDPTFGSNEDFVQLCKIARQNGMRVMIDGVFSHTGDNSVYFDRYGLYGGVGAYQSKKSPYYSWYKFEEYPDEYSCWWDFKTLPETQEDDPAFRDFIIRGENSVVAQWVKRGASGWRLDVADELPDDFICELRARVKEVDPDAAVLGEVWEDASNKVAYGQLRSYGLGKSLDSVMNYPLRSALLNFFTGKGDSKSFAQAILSLYENYPRPMFYALMNLIGIHDRERTLNVLAGMGCEGVDKELWADLVPDKARYLTAKKKLKAIFATICALPGMPTIYYGDEAGMTGAGDPYNRGTYPWGKEDADLIAHYESVIAKRKSDPIWAKGELDILAPHPDVILILRAIQGGKDALGNPAKDGHMLYAINRSQEPVQLVLTAQDVKLAPFMATLTELKIPPLTPCYFQA